MVRGERNKGIRVREGGKNLIKRDFSGKPRAAASDVASTEPIENGNALLKAPNLLITPHMAWATVEARKRLMQMTADNVQAFQNGSPINLVN